MKCTKIRHIDRFGVEHVYTFENGRIHVTNCFCNVWKMKDLPLLLENMK